MKLGRLAYDDLFSSETHLVFRVEDLENYLGDYELDFALKVGLLSKCEAPGSCNDENVSINFFHKSLQEFLAAVYIEDNVEVIQLYGHLSTFKSIMDLRNVLLFLSGLNSKFGSGISQYIVSVVESDTEILRYRTLSDPAINTQHKVELLYKLHVSCYMEMVSSQSKIDKQVVPYHVSDVYLHNDSNIETIWTTADILANHPADIKSLWLYKVPTDEENGIPDSLLTQYLASTRSLMALLVDGCYTNRTIDVISNRTSSLTALLLYSVTLTPDAMSALQTALRSNLVIQTVGLVNIKCKVNLKCLSASLGSLLRILPDLPRLTSLHIAVTNNDDKPVLRDVLPRLSHLRGIFYYSSNPADDAYDCSVIQSMCTWSNLRWFSLFWIAVLGENGLQLPISMVNLEMVRLLKVDMTAEGWSKFIHSIFKIKHGFDVCLKAVHINERSLNMILSSPQVKVTYNKADKNGSRDMIFTRLWPLSQR